MRNAEPLALVGELVIARILWNRGKHRPHQYRQQDRGEADGVSTGKGSPEVRKRWLDDLFHACLCAGSSCLRADVSSSQTRFRVRRAPPRRDDDLVFVTQKSRSAISRARPSELFAPSNKWTKATSFSHQAGTRTPRGPSNRDRIFAEDRLRFGTLRYRCASVGAIGCTQASTLGMRCPPGLAALHLHAAVQRKLRTRTAGLARVSRGARGMLLRHARWGGVGAGGCATAAGAPVAGGAGVAWAGGGGNAGGLLPAGESAAVGSVG